MEDPDNGSTAAASAAQDDEQAFFDAWEEFVNATRESRYRANAERRGPLTLSQYHLIKSLDDGPLPSMDVAARARVSGATSTRMLDALEGMGLIARKPSKQDGRVVMVSLTASGRRNVREMREVVDAKRRAVHASLDAEDRKLAARILHSLAEAVRRTDP
jgi:DNA-binding MarR family transcriptional regulator